MLRNRRSLTLGFALATFLGFQGSSGEATASFIYANSINPTSVSSSSGKSKVVFAGASGGPLAVDGTAHTITLLTAIATSTSATGETLSNVTLSDTLTITDGGHTGTFTITAVFHAAGLDSAGGGTFSLTNPTISASPIVINGDTYSLSGLVFNKPTTNGATGTATALLTATVPEPASAVLLGLGGVVALTGIRPRKRA